ncbi:GTP-binding protein Rho1 [Chytriomyces hyalinus]|nr:GTP-binding protein Rho1 [Chytriomyces hyalinus]
MDTTYAPLIPAQKVVVVGDGACGKTNLLNVLIRGVFPEMYEPTIVEVEDTALYVDGHAVTLNLWDTTGQEEYDRLRSLAYGGNTSAVLIAFAVDSPTSLENVESLWFPEVVQYCPNVPIFLVALKVDLRNDAAAIAELAKTNMAPLTETEVY